MLAYIIIFVVLLIAFSLLFTSREMFGKRASGRRLERIRNSRFYKDGRFQNITPTPDLSGDTNIFLVLMESIFGKDKRNRPADALPSQKTDLKNLDPGRDWLVWFGHSSYFLQAGGRKFLIDPVFSGAASPFSFSIKSYKGADAYKPEDMPEIDYLVITHDHWDHLDFRTVKTLKPKVKKIVTGLGTAAHLEYWGYGPEQIFEHDWNEASVLEEGFRVTGATSRHFSGRGLFDRKKTLWASFILETPDKKIYLGGDSGYDTHFKELGEKYGPFDLAILECGQYNKNWKYSHMHPEEVLQAALDLNAKALLPVHWGKFSLASHSWDEPIIRISALAKNAGLPLLTPMMGQSVDLNALNLPHKEWWLGIK